MSRLNVILVIVDHRRGDHLVVRRHGHAATSGRILERYFALPQNRVCRPKTDRSDGRRLKTLDQLERENEAAQGGKQRASRFQPDFSGPEAENSKLRSALEYRKRSIFKLLPADHLARRFRLVEHGAH